MSTSRPKLTLVKPSTLVALKPTQLYLKGIDFATGMQVSVNGSLLATTAISDNEVSITLTAGLAAGDYSIYAVNPDGGITNSYPLTSIGRTASNGYDRWTRKLVDPQSQPLPIPRNTRSDSQRVAAGQDFTQSIPDAPQGTWLDGSAPTLGGVWRYNGDVIVKELHFKANGTEGVARGATSGFYVIRKSGAIEFKFAVGGTTYGTAADVNNRQADIYMDKGETLYLITTGATLEMIATVVVDSRTPGSHN